MAVGLIITLAYIIFTYFLQANTNILSEFFVGTQVKHYYLGLHLLLKKVMEDMKKMIAANKNLVPNSLKSNIISLLQNIVSESCNLNIEGHQLLLSLNSIENQNLHSLPDKINNEHNTNCDDKSTKNLKSNSELMVQLTELEQKVKDLNDLLEMERFEAKDQKIKDSDKYTELESNMECLKNEYDKCEDYWASKLNEERDIFDQEQRITDDKFAELLTKLSEYEEQFASQDVKNDRFDGPLSTIEEKYNLEKQFTDLEDEFEKYKVKAEHELDIKTTEINQLKEQLEQLEKSKITPSPVENGHTEALSVTVTDGLLSSSSSCEKELGIETTNVSKVLFPNVEQPQETFARENLEKISSPIDYLWNQSAIPSPISNVRNSSDIARDYHNPAFFKDQFSEPNDNFSLDLPPMNVASSIMPIQKPISSMIKTSQVAPKSQGKNLSEKKMLFCSELEAELQARRREVLHLEATRTRLEAEIRNLTLQRGSPQHQVVIINTNLISNDSCN